jgi:hypothetical protein
MEPAPDIMNQIPSPGFPPSRFPAWLRPARIVCFLLYPGSRYVLAWLIALFATTLAVIFAWRDFNNPNRPDGNNGHVTIDFGGQWLMGRMLIKGHARHLYDRNYHRTILEESYPRADQAPDQDANDADKLLSWLMGEDDSKARPVIGSFLTPLAATDPLTAAALLDAGRTEWTEERLARVTAPHVGGPLYPPINMFIFGPLGLLRPQAAYRAMQAFNVFLIYLAALGICLTTRGRIWWPVAVTLIIIFPGFSGALVLGQNALLSLSLLVFGWWQIGRGRPILGGVLWGLLAYKPVWLVAFFLVPVLTRRWRVCGAMIATGAVLSLATLPLAGLQPWFDWFHVGREATALYDTDTNWIFLSRDLLGVPRRYLLDFREDAEELNPHGPLPKILGVSWVTGVVLITIALALRRPRQATALEGPAPAFLLLGAWMSCFHFMYYDVLLAILPVCLLFTEPRRYFEQTFLEIRVLRPTAVPFWNELAGYYRPQPGLAMPPVAFLSAVPLPAGRGSLWVLNRAAPTLLVLLLALPPLAEWFYVAFRDAHHEPPFDTFCLFALWLWCGWTWWRSGEERGAWSVEREDREMALA